MPNKQNFGGAFLMDLSKACNAINHELLTVKLNPYGFSIEAPEVLFTYLQKKKVAKNQDQYNFQFLDSVTSRSSTRISCWSHTV